MSPFERVTSARMAGMIVRGMGGSLILARLAELACCPRTLVERLRSCPIERGNLLPELGRPLLFLGHGTEL